MTKHMQLFPGANTPQGFRSLYREGLYGIEHIFILKGGPGIGKSTLMRQLAAELDKFGYACELWQCSSDSSSLDGVICRSIGFAVIDGTAPHVLDPQYPGVREEIVNLGEFWDEKTLRASAEEIISLFKSISRQFNAGYASFAKAEEHRLAAMEICDTPYDRRLEKQLLSAIFEPQAARRSFSSAVTDSGLICYAESISSSCRRRYLLSGRQNKNGALLLAALRDAALERGLPVEAFYSPFEPESMELLLLPALSVAVIDCSQRHISVTERSNDVVFDMQPPVPVAENEREREHETAFEQELQNTVESFASAKKKHDELEAFYTQAMDFAGVEAKGRELMDKLLLIIKQNS